MESNLYRFNTGNEAENHVVLGEAKSGEIDLSLSEAGGHYASLQSR
ncbi:hypothetical protein [Pedobacter sp.]